MSDELDSIPEPTAEEMAAINALLARAEIWDDAPDGLEDSVVAAITAEAATVDDERPAAFGTPLTSLDEQRARRAGRAMPWWLGAAAACAVIVAGIALVARGSDDGDRDDGLLVALSPTDAAPGASASAIVTATPAGLKIVLDVDNLPGAPEDAYYEAWLSDGTTRISAGTFHLRGGDDPIALWAGIADPAFNKLSVTLEPVDGDTDSSGDVRFTGEFDLDT